MRTFQLLRIADMLFRRSVASSKGRWNPLPCESGRSDDDGVGSASCQQRPGAPRADTTERVGRADAINGSSSVAGGARHEVEGPFPGQVDVRPGLEDGLGAAVAQVPAENLGESALMRWVHVGVIEWVEPPSGGKRQLVARRSACEDYEAGAASRRAVVVRDVRAPGCRPQRT